MAEDVQNQDKSPEVESNEISLENIDEILQQEDPGFVDSLSEIKEAGSEVSDVEIELLNVDVGNGNDDEEDKETRIEQYLNKLLKKYPRLKIFSKVGEKSKKFVKQRVFIWRGKIRLWFFNGLEHIKTWPDRLKKFKSDLGQALSFVLKQLKAGFSNRTRTEKILILALVFGCGFVVGLSILNFKNNRWIPFLTRPILTSLENVATNEWEFSLENGTLPFLTAFPQTKHNYLFPKVVVNLKAKSERDSFTMGAFEFYVEVDSKDTAIEVKSREVELHDLIQRVTETFTFESLQTEKGKDRLKEEIKKSLNQKIVQGWVKDVYIKFMITKP